jgi:hypothetical protein
MIALDFLHLLGLGGLCGFFGQVIRALVGLKKAKHYAPKNTTLEINIGQLVITCTLGFVMGAIGLVAMHQDADEPISKNMIITMIAIGYAGTDFLEGLLGVFIKNKENP